MRRLAVFVSVVLSVLAAFAVSAADVRAYFVPAKVRCGAPFELVLESDSQLQPELLRQPDNIEISDVRGGIAIDGGTIKATVRYRCVARTPGTINASPLAVRLGGRDISVAVPPLEVEEVKPLAPIDGADAAAAELATGAPLATRWLFPGNRTKFYVGELVETELRLYCRGARGVSYPQLDLGKALITDFSPINPQNKDFAPPIEGAEVINGVNYGIIAFRTSFRPLAPGKVQFTATQVVSMASGGFRGNETQLSYTSPEVTIEPVPQPPDDAVPLGLVGNWQVAFAQTAFQVPAGGNVPLVLTITGDGPLEFLSAPVLTIPGCRVLPGDLWTRPGYNYSRLTYAVIPLTEGEIKEKLRFSTFNPGSAKYDIAEYDFKLKVVPGNASSVGAAAEPPPEISEDAAAQGPSPLEPRTLLKPRPAAAVELPLWTNGIGITLGVLLAGPAMLGLAEWLRRRAVRRRNSPELIRRASALGRRRSVLRHLKHAGVGEFAGVVNTELVPFLNDAMNLPPGTDASGIAAKTGDTELAEHLRKAAELGYLPEFARDPAHVSHLRAGLLRAVKRATVVFLVFAAALSASGQWSDGCSLLADGRAPEAMNTFEQLCDPMRPDPCTLFNLGSAAYLSKDYPTALWAFERAHLLAPRDHETVDSLNALRRRFFIPEAGANATTAELAASLRDTFRPDEYMLAAAVLVFMVFLLLLFRRRVGKWQLRFSAAAGFLCAALLAGVAAWQLATSYRTGLAMVVKNTALLRTLPSDSANVNGIPLRGGTRVEVEDARDGFARAVVNGQTGYLRTDEFRRLL